MFGFGVKKRVRELQEQLKELNTRINRQAGSYMELLTKVNKIPTVEQTRANIEELLSEENFAETLEDMSESSKRRFCKGILDFISTDGFMRDRFHEVMDEPIRHLMPDVPDLDDYVTYDYVCDLINERAWDAVSSDVDEAIQGAVSDALEETDLQDEIEKAATAARTQATSEEVKCMIREQLSKWASQLTPPGCSREEAISKLKPYFQTFFDGSRMVYQSKSYGRYTEISADRFEAAVNNVMTGTDPRWA